MFASLYSSYLRGELLCVDGGMCRYHVRKDNTLVIYEILSYKKGAGITMLSILKALQPAKITAKCPQQLESNTWYAHNEFTCVGKYVTKSGSILNVYELNLS